MKNKVLTEIYVPQLDEEFNIFLPLNKNVADVIVLICKSIGEIKRIDNIEYSSFCLYNRETSLRYPFNKTIKETNIRNGFRLLLM